VGMESCSLIAAVSKQRNLFEGRGISAGKINHCMDARWDGQIGLVAMIVV